jgi:glycosyltransferase involved in cell wall biosynthesis
LNPSLTDEELSEGLRAARVKDLEKPLRMLFVGGLEPAKGGIRTVEILAELLKRGADVNLDIVGDGPERPVIEQRADVLGCRDYVTFHGWLARQDIPALYRKAHIMLLPSDSEGWPKVLSEAMAYGVVPLASDVGSIPQILKRCGTGAALPKDDIRGFADAVEAYVTDENRWKVDSAKGVEAAPLFGYGYYLDRISELLHLERREPVLSAPVTDSTPNA